MFLVLQSKHTLCYLIWTKGENCWASDFRNILFSLGIGYVCLQQGVGCDTVFISLFKQRLTDIFKQKRSASLLQKEMYAKYRNFKSVLRSEKYFNFVNTKSLRDYLVKLRLELFPLNSSNLTLYLPVTRPLAAITAMKLITKNI